MKSRSRSQSFNQVSVSKGTISTTSLMIINFCVFCYASHAVVSETHLFIFSCPTYTLSRLDQKVLSWFVEYDNVFRGAPFSALPRALPPTLSPPGPPLSTATIVIIKWSLEKAWKRSIKLQVFLLQTKFGRYLVHFLTKFGCIQRCKGTGTRGNGVPTPFPRFALQWVWSCFKMAIFLMRSHTFIVSTTSVDIRYSLYGEFATLIQKE